MLKKVCLFGISIALCAVFSSSIYASDFEIGQSDAVHHHEESENSATDDCSISAYVAPPTGIACESCANGVILFHKSTGEIPGDNILHQDASGNFHYDSTGTISHRTLSYCNTCSFQSYSYTMEPYLRCPGFKIYV